MNPGKAFRLVRDELSRIWAFHPCEDCWWWQKVDPEGSGDMGTCDKHGELFSADGWCEDFEDRADVLVTEMDYMEASRVELGIEEE